MPRGQRRRHDRQHPGRQPDCVPGDRHHPGSQGPSGARWDARGVPPALSDRVAGARTAGGGPRWAAGRGPSCRWTGQQPWITVQSGEAKNSTRIEPRWRRRAASPRPDPHAIADGQGDSTITPSPTATWTATPERPRRRSLRRSHRRRPSPAPGCRHSLRPRRHPCCRAGSSSASRCGRNGLAGASNLRSTVAALWAGAAAWAAHALWLVARLHRRAGAGLGVGRGRRTFVAGPLTFALDGARAPRDQQGRGEQETSSAVAVSPMTVTSNAA